MAALGVGWEEQLFHLHFPSIGARFPILFLICVKLVIIGIETEVVLKRVFVDPKGEMTNGENC